MVLESLEVGGEIELEKENHILVSSSQDGLEMIVEEIRARVRSVIFYTLHPNMEKVWKRELERSEQQSHKRKKFLIVLYRFVNMQMNCSTILIPTIVFI